MGIIEIHGATLPNFAEMTSRWWFYPLIAFAALCLAGLLLLGYAAVIAYPRLPSIQALEAYQPKIPLQI